MEMRSVSFGFSFEPDTFLGFRCIIHLSPLNLSPRRFQGNGSPLCLPRRVMSAFGTKRTFRDVCSLSTFGGKADIYVQIEFSAFDPADIGSQASVETIAVLIRVSRYPGGAP